MTGLERMIRNAVADELRSTAAGNAVPNASDVLGADEVAALLKLSRNSVYQAAGRGEIPCRRVGRRFVFSRAALMSWLGAHGREVPESEGNDARVPRSSR